MRVAANGKSHSENKSDSNTQSLATGDVKNAHMPLAETAADHHGDIEKCNGLSDVCVSDGQNNSSCPVLGKFYNNGKTGTIFFITSFSCDESQQIHNRMDDSLQQVLCLGRGKRSLVLPEHRFTSF